MNAPSVFSRILLILGSVSVVVLTYWFIATSLAPVSVPAAPPLRGSVRFDPSADVTKKPHFTEMHLLGPQEVKPSQLGRINPFVPIPPQQFIPTTTLPVIVTPPTSTPSATSTTP